jgi:hypothetical protein
VGARCITFGTLGSAIGRIVGHLQEQPAVRERWAEAVGRDVGDPEVVAPLLLRHARLINPSGTTLFATTRAQRLLRTVDAAASAAADDSVAALVALVDSELADPTRRTALR